MYCISNFFILYSSLSSLLSLILFQLYLWVIMQAAIHDTFESLNSTAPLPELGSFGYVTLTSTLYVLTDVGWLAIQVRVELIVVRSSESLCP